MIVNHSLGAAVRVLPGLDAMYLDHKDRIGCNLDFGVVTMFCGDTDTSRRVLLGNWASLGGVGGGGDQHGDGDGDGDSDGDGASQTALQLKRNNSAVSWRVGPGGQGRAGQDWKHASRGRRRDEMQNQKTVMMLPSGGRAKQRSSHPPSFSCRLPLDLARSQLCGPTVMKIGSFPAYFTIPFGRWSSPQKLDAAWR